MNRVVLYARVSTDEQADEGHSIDAQIRLLREFCARKGWTIVGEYIDAGVSGTTLRRPEFQRMLKAARSGEFDIIVVHKLDRFSRSLLDTLTMLSELSRGGVSFCSATEDFDFTTPIGKVLLALLAAFAQYFIDNLRAETKKGKRERALKGLYNGVVPLGYLAVPKDEGGVPVPHPQNAGAYREIIRRCVNGESAETIAQWLNTNGYRTSGNRGQNLFTGDGVLDIARNRFHLGEVSYKSVWRPGKHAPLVEVEMWNKAQAELRRRSSYRETTKRADKVYPLRKLVYCAQCGKPLRGQQNHGKRFYRDMSAVRKLCAQPQIVNAELLESQLGEFFARLRLPENWRDQILSRFVSNSDAQQIQAQRRALQNELARARKLYIAGDLDEEAWLKEKNRIQQSLNALQPIEFPDMERAAQLLSTIGVLWTNANDTERLNLAKALLEKIWIRDQRIVALEPRVSFFALFDILQKESPSKLLDGDNGDLWSPPGATGVNPSSAFNSPLHLSTDSTDKIISQVIVILPPGSNLTLST